jgi:hypothetical protein
MLGLAFVVAVAGVCWIVAQNPALDDSQEIWSLPAVIGGVFIGALIPFTGRVAGWLVAPAAVVIGAFGATHAEHLIALCVIGAALGGVFFGLFIPYPGQRER